MANVIATRKLSSLSIDEVHSVLQSVNIDIPKEVLETNKIDGELLSLAENAEELSELNIRLPALKMKLLLKKILLLNEEGIQDSILGKRNRDVIDLVEDKDIGSIPPDTASSASSNDQPFISSSNDQPTMNVVPPVTTTSTTALPLNSNAANDNATRTEPNPPTSSANQNRTVLNSNDPNRLHSLGVKYNKENNQQEAFRFYKLAADKGHVTAMCYVGRRYNTGTGVAVDHGESLRYLHKAAAAGSSDANFSLGNVYNNDTGMPKDSAKKAFEYYTAASLQGHAEAHFKLGKFYQAGWGGVRKSLKNYFNHVKMSVELGCNRGLSDLGGCYLYGEGTKKDKNLAFESFLKDAKGGSAISQFNVGVCYDTAPDIDYAKAYEWYKKSADQNYSTAQYCVAVCLNDGLGVAVNKDDAYMYCKKAADQGDKEAQQLLTTDFANYLIVV